MDHEYIDHALERTMSEKTKVALYTILLLALFTASFIYSNNEKDSCESIGGIYTRQSMSWSYECITEPSNTDQQ